jgi:hypothetical protein
VVHAIRILRDIRNYSGATHPELILDQIRKTHYLIYTPVSGKIILLVEAGWDQEVRLEVKMPDVPSFVLISSEREKEDVNRSLLIVCRYNSPKK